jgi:hypothetical protein
MRLARRTSKWLIVVFIPVVAIMVALVAFIIAPAYFYIAVGISNVASGEAGAGMFRYAEFPREFFIFAALLTTSIIIIASMFKRSALSSGGGTIAVAQGGTQIGAADTNPLARRLRNVVEEMAIASGAPVPEIYVLEKEYSINAFAAGFTTGDAVIAVTRGALQSLNRGDHFDITAKVGYFVWKSKTSLFNPAIGTLSQDDDGSDPMIGIGARYRFSDRISFRGEYEHFSDIDDEDGSLLSLGFAYSF